MINDFSVISFLIVLFFITITVVIWSQTRSYRRDIRLERELDHFIHAQLAHNDLWSKNQEIRGATINALHRRLAQIEMQQQSQQTVWRMCIDYSAEHEQHAQILADMERLQEAWETISDAQKIKTLTLKDGHTMHVIDAEE